MQLYEQTENSFASNLGDNGYDLEMQRLLIIAEGGASLTLEGWNEVMSKSQKIMFSVFKQSFIKFLEGECERLGELRRQNLNSVDKIEEREERDRMVNLLNENMVTGYQLALSDTISHYQNMIKELQV